MLRTFIALLVLTLSSTALACWKAHGSLAVDGETFKFDQKVEHKKEYLVSAGTFILRFTVVPKGKSLTLNYVVEEKKNLKLILVTKGQEEDIKEGKTREIYAKGEEGQPHSIITIKLTQI